MSFVQHGSFVKPRIGQAISLQRGHIDPATLVLTFHYQELVQNAGVWSVVDHQEVLVESTHFTLDIPRGQITLIDNPFWQQQGTWRAGDRAEPLLYKNMVKHPQRIEFSYEHYEPEGVKVLKRLDDFGLPEVVIARRAGQEESVDLTEEDPEAEARLGYTMRRFSADV